MKIRRKNKGAVLIVSLIMLLLLSLLAVNSMKTTIVEEKITGNYRDKNTAFQSAEAALRAAENYIDITTPVPNFDGTNGLYLPTITGVSRWGLIDWTDATEVVSYVGLGGVVEQPKYIIEQLELVDDPYDTQEGGVAKQNHFYRITARAVGGTETAVVMLQSVFKRN